MAQLEAPAAAAASPCAHVPRAAGQRRELLRLLRGPAGAPVTDDEAFEEPVEQPRCPACLAAVEPDQQYCLQCGERLAPAGPPPSSPLRGRSRPPAAAIVAVGALLLLLGGFGIAYGFTRDDTPEGRPAPPPSRRAPPPAPSCRRRCRSTPGQSVPTFTDVSTGTDASHRHGHAPRHDADVPDRQRPRRPSPPTPAAGHRHHRRESDWPPGKDAYAVILSSDDTEKFTFESITAKKQQAIGAGFDERGRAELRRLLHAQSRLLGAATSGPTRRSRRPRRRRPRRGRTGYPDAYVRRVAE